MCCVNYVDRISFQFICRPYCKKEYRKEGIQADVSLYIRFGCQAPTIQARAVAVFLNRKEPQVNEAQVTESQDIQPQLIEPQITEPQLTEPQLAEPRESEPKEMNRR